MTLTTAGWALTTRSSTYQILYGTLQPSSRRTDCSSVLEPSIGHWPRSSPSHHSSSAVFLEQTVLVSVVKRGCTLENGATSTQCSIGVWQAGGVCGGTRPSDTH